MITKKQKINVASFFKPFMPSGHVYPSLRIGSFPIKVVYFEELSCIIKLPVLTANSIDPDLTPQNSASDEGLHCLPMTLFMGRQA